jgi:tryptophanyl-tRNA synthetase
VGAVHLDWQNQPGISNLLTIGSLLNGQDIAADWEGKTNYGELKAFVAGQVESFLTNLQANAQTITDEQILLSLQRGEAAANQIANPALLRVQKAVGLRP